MTRAEQIEELSTQRQEAYDELNELAGGKRCIVPDGMGGTTDVTDQRKEVLADRFNELTTRIEKLTNA